MKEDLCHFLAKESSIPPVACIPIVGCGDQTFKEYIWEHLNVYKPKEGPLSSLTRAKYDEICAGFKKDPNPRKFLYGQTYLYWSKALDINEGPTFLTLECPSLVITGEKDLGCAASETLVKKALKLKKKVRYLKIPEADHFVTHPKYGLIKEIGKYILQLGKEPEELRYEVV